MRGLRRIFVETPPAPRPAAAWCHDSVEGGRGLARQVHGLWRRALCTKHNAESARKGRQKVPTALQVLTCLSFSAYVWQSHYLCAQAGPCTGLPSIPGLMPVSPKRLRSYRSCNSSFEHRKFLGIAGPFLPSKDLSPARRTCLALTKISFEFSSCVRSASPSLGLLLR